MNVKKALPLNGTERHLLGKIQFQNVQAIALILKVAQAHTLKGPRASQNVHDVHFGSTLFPTPQ
jgi:hypothetical protein